MRRFPLVAACVLAVVGVAAEQPALHPVSIPDLLSLKQVGAPQLSPDGRSVLYTVRAWENGSGRDSQRKEARSHVWRVNVDGSAVRQLTFSDRGETSPQWSPDGRTITFVSSRDAAAAGSAGDGRWSDQSALDDAGRRRRGAQADRHQGIGDRLRVVAKRQVDRLRRARSAVEGRRREAQAARRSAGVRRRLPALAPFRR